jgi:hypothetical protein
MPNVPQSLSFSSSQKRDKMDSLGFLQSRGSGSTVMALTAATVLAVALASAVVADTGAGAVAGGFAIDSDI